MIRPEVIKARYPDPPPPPDAWVGWRRKKVSQEPWDRVNGSMRSTKGACYQALMELSELTGTSEPVEYEYLILADGERPPALQPGQGRLR